MTEQRNGYTTISIRIETKERLARAVPKFWDWDRVLAELAEMFEKQQGKVTRTGKPSEDNQTS